MGLFGSSSGDTSGFSGSSGSSDRLDLSAGLGASDSKLRSPSSSFSGSSDFGGAVESHENTDIQSFVQIEAQKQQLMSQVSKWNLGIIKFYYTNCINKLLFDFQYHKVNEVCWDMCVSSVGSSLGSRTENCLTNCTHRFIDTTLLITNRFAQLAQKMQGH